ncbi:MAG TPA: ABC transporter permease subunit [Candidatus Limnocylindria bacterium]|nr:ABC transporter permease subunit [Candidatus Limnocylindria bacterium]
MFFRIPRRALLRLASPLVILALWQGLSALGVIPARIIASPATIAATFWTLATTGRIGVDLAVSLGRVAAGLAIGIASGTVLAIVAASSRRGETIIDPPMQMIRAVPLLGLTPLLILWFGIGETPKIALVALSSTFPVYLTLFGGIRSVDPKLVEAACVFGLDRWGLIRHVIVPGALPSALVGVRYALGAAWLSLVVGEQINADRGIGHVIMDARDFLRTDIIVVGLVIYALLGLASDAIVRAIEHRALAWRPSLVRAEA